MEKYDIYLNMKIINYCIVLLVMLVIFSTCKTSNEKQIDFNYQYLRTSKHENTNPIITTVFSRSELEKYYEKSCPNDYYPDENIDYFAKIFRNSIENYSNEFFIDYFLVIILINEKNCSIRHEVEKIDEYGEILINRLLPIEMTDDLAEWHIVIELEKKYYENIFVLKIVDKNI